MKGEHPVVSKIKALLTERTIWFETFEHEPVRTSEEASQVRSGYTLREGAKALIVRLKKNGERTFAMIVVSGDKRFDAKKARDVLSVQDIRFAQEEEVEQITGGVEPGGIPPFGNIFNIPVFADTSVFDNERIIFNAGDRRVSIGMKAKDYMDVVKPHVVSIV